MELDIDGDRQSVRLSRNGRQHILRLIPAGPAEGEEVIGTADDADLRCTPPVFSELAIPEVAPFGGLYDGEAYLRLGSQSLPIDVALVVADVDTLDRIVLE